MFLVFCHGHFKVELFFSWLPWTHTHWDYARQWSLVYPGCATSCLAQVLCMVMQWPLSYSWNQDVLSVQSLRAQQGWRLWEIFFSCFLCLCSTSRRIHENTTSTAGDGKSWLWHVAIDRTVIDCSTLLPRYANKLDGKAWFGWWNLHELLRKGSTLNLARDVWHGSWIYRTGPYSPKQTKDMLSFFCCPTWLVFFLHKSLFSVAVPLQNATKPFCGYPAMRRRCNSRPITCKSQRCFSQLPKWISWNFSAVIFATRSRRDQMIDDI